MDVGSSAEARRAHGWNAVLRAGVLVASASSLLVPAVAGAQSAPIAPVTVASLVRELDADDLAVRERASRQLSSMLEATSLTGSNAAGGAISQSLVDEIRTNRLSLEQRQRVLEILRGRFMNSPRGAIGVQFDQTGMGVTSGMRIQGLVSGFPAHERGVLRVGDVIVEVLGIPVGLPGTGLRTVQPIVASHDPGDMVEMTVVRPDDGAAMAPGQPGVAPALITEGEQKNATRLSLQVPLGSFADLGGGGFLGRALLESAWRACMERLGIGDIRTKTIGFGLTPSDWNRGLKTIERPVEGLRLAGSALPAAYEDPTRAEVASTREMDIAELIRRNNVRIAPNALPGGNMNAIRNAELVEKLKLVERQNRQADELELANRQISGLSQQLEALQIQRRSAKSAEERERIEATMSVLKDRLSKLLDDVQRLRRPQPAQP